jgi:hypothetical protein
MEKSLVKTDQMSAKAAAVTARKPAMPARRAVSASRSGRNARRLPGGDQPQGEAPASRL